MATLSSLYRQGNGGRDKPATLGLLVSASDCASEKAKAVSLLRLVSLRLWFCCHRFQEALLTSPVPLWTSRSTAQTPGQLERRLGNMENGWVSELGSPASTPDFESDWSGVNSLMCTSRGWSNKLTPAGVQTICSMGWSGEVPVKCWSLPVHPSLQSF